MERYTKPLRFCFRLSKTLYFPLILFLGFTSVVALLLWFVAPLRFNFSSSMPIGIYRLDTRSLIVRGDLVEVCLPYSIAKFAKTRGYIGVGQCALHSEALLKEVVGIEGDYVCMSTRGMLVNKHLLPHSAALFRDSHHRLLSSIHGCYTLKPHQLWLYGNNSVLSFDSRYFGSVDVKNVITIVKPLIIFKRN